MNLSNNFCSVLKSLPSGSEVTFHTYEKSYYNTIFKKYYTETNTALFVVDPFYNFGGYPVLVPCHEIASMDLPNSVQGVSDEDE